MTEFYHNSVTDKSFQFLRKLNKDYNFVLIGGWAVFLYTQSLKSKDIDIVVDYDQLGKLKNNFIVNKNDRLKKYEIKTGGFDIDIYVVHFSELGVPIDLIIETAKKREGFLIPTLEILFVLKLYAWERRRGSIKGKKDELDLLSLAFLSEFDWFECLQIINKIKLETEYHNFISLLEKTKNIPELELNEQQVSKLKKEIGARVRSFGKA